MEAVSLEIVLTDMEEDIIFEGLSANSAVQDNLNIVRLQIVYKV